MYIFHTWTRALNIFFFLLPTIDPKYLANKTLCDNTYRGEKTWNESIFKSIGRANSVLQRQAKKKSSPKIKKEVVSCTRCRSIFHLLLHLLQFESSWKEKLFYGFSREQWNQIDKSSEQTKKYLRRKSRRNQNLRNPTPIMVYEKWVFPLRLLK